LRGGAQPFGHARREPASISKTLAAQGLSCIDEICGRALIAHGAAPSPRVASAGPIRAAAAAAASAIHHSLSGVAVFLVVL
jgi:hypothetical protein